MFVKGVAVWGNGSSLDTKSLSLVTGFSYFWADLGRARAPYVVARGLTASICAGTGLPFASVKFGLMVWVSLRATGSMK